MNRIFKLEIKRAFRNRLFAATLCVAFAICVWHFMENVWIWRMYIYSDTYPLSAYEKWIGADNVLVILQDRHGGGAVGAELCIDNRQ